MDYRNGCGIMMDWEKLLNKAFSCIDYAEKMAGQATFVWSFGGRTAMMQKNKRYGN